MDIANYDGYTYGQRYTTTIDLPNGMLMNYVVTGVIALYGFERL